MKLHNLKSPKNTKGKHNPLKTRKRVGRGEGSGYGGSSGRGTKGAKSRSGFKNKRYYEGGQTPLQMRLPKFGFNNPNKVTFSTFNLNRIEEIAEKYNVTEIDISFLVEKGYIKKNEKVKILGDGELTKALKITVNAASKSAQSAIESMGGSVTFV